MKRQLSASTPSVSVVVVVLGGRSYIPRCLNALISQTRVQEAEIIVPCDHRIENVPELQKQFPAVRFLPIEGHRTYAELRTIGVQQAHGGIIALTEDHCIPNPDWCAQILQAHSGPHAAIGGVVDKEEPDTALNWALYLADYVRYASPTRERLASQLTDCNVSYKRLALEEIASAWHDEFHEPIVHAVLRERGQSLWLSPEIIVCQQRSLSLSDALRDRYAFGRLFGSARVASVSPSRRLMLASLTFLLPLLLVGRVARHVYHKRRYLGAFLRALPLLTLLSAVWAWGELLGYLTGRPAASLRTGMLGAEARL